MKLALRWLDGSSYPDAGDGRLFYKLSCGHGRDAGCGRCVDAGAVERAAGFGARRRGADAVPCGIAIFPQDLTTPPREFAERSYNVQRWTVMPRGGHFAALEQPDLLADDIRQFFAHLSA